MRTIIDAAKKVAVKAAELGTLTFGVIVTGSGMIDAVNSHSWTAAEHVAIAAATAAAAAAITIINAALKAALSKAA